MEGWWCVRHGDALPWVEAPSATAALRRSLDLHSLGDCTDDACKLVVFPQDTYPENAGRHDYNRAVLNARRARARRRPSRGALGCLAGLLAIMFVADASTSTIVSWRWRESRRRRLRPPPFSFPLP